MKYAGSKLKEISFPLGGIGTGSVGLGGDGRLLDWEIFNRPSKGSVNGYSHFAIKAIQDGRVTAAVLNGDLRKDFMGQYTQSASHKAYGFGPRSEKMCGFPHFRNQEFNGEFPVAELTFRDASFPGSVKMTAFNPLIPHDAKNSGIPGAFFEIEVCNTTEAPVQYQIAFSVANPFEKSRNRVETRNGRNILMLCNSGADPAEVGYGDLSVATDSDSALIQPYWYRGGWQDAIVSFWNEFSSLEGLSNRQYDSDGGFDTGTVAADLTLAPKETRRVRFILTWNIPNNRNDWNPSDEAPFRDQIWKNYYATVFQNSLDSADYALSNWDTLFERTQKFRRTLYGSTLPEPVIDAAAANLSVLKSATVWRLEDGTFYGWEGTSETAGSCEGTCQHVWNYAYALCFLFPELERSIREAEFRYSTDENGRTGFRLQLPLGRKMTDFRACVDGQMGCVIKSYREWKISGDNEWLKEQWPTIKKVLEYAWSEKNYDGWDRDHDGVLEGRQHHTLDMELFGPSSWLEGMYLAALKAAAEMADFLGDPAADEYRGLFVKGYQWTKENLFNGSYFIQKIDVADETVPARYQASDRYWNSEVHEIKYQVGEGSLLDQMLAQWHADILGLGRIYDEEQTKTALASMMKNNFKPSMRGLTNPWRIFSLEDEAGSVICVYPEGAKKPKITVPYSEETMTGFEYSFAGLLCSQGMVEDGIRVVAAVRSRFDGEKRNPWNEFECGSNYARSMASYALVPLLSGFDFDMPRHHIGFHPYQTDAFRCIWSVAASWGSVSIEKSSFRLEIAEGTLSLASIGLPFTQPVSSVKIDGKETDFRWDGENVCFDITTIARTVEITA